MANDQEGQVRDRIEVARADAGRLESRLRGLSDEQLAHPSACDRWTVADVAAHLAFVAQFQNRMIGRGLQGDDSVPEAARQQGPDAPPASEMIAQGALSLRERLGDGLLDTFHERYQQLFELLDSMAPDDYAKPCWHPRGDTTVADFVDLVVNELAIHGWDALSLPWTPTITWPKMRYPLASTSAAMCWLAWHGLSRECWARSGSGSS